MTRRIIRSGHLLMYYILHGEDEFTRSEQVNKFRKEMGDPQFADLNITWLDGRKTTVSEIGHTCDAMPFLLDKRLVIVEGLLTRLETRGKSESEDSDNEQPASGAAKDLIAYLEHLPESTRLVFVEPKSLAKNNSVLKYADATRDKKQAHVKEFPKLKPRDLPAWIQKRVQLKNGKMELPAAHALADHIGADLRLLDNEIEKLITYQRGATVTANDVRELVAAVRESNVFDFVDALGKRQAKTALDLLHHQLEHGNDALPLFGMMVRQFRLLLQMKDLAMRGMTLDAANQQMKMHPFAAQKMWEQSTNFSLPRLEEIYRRLLETDIAIKTGRSEPLVALDVLVV